MAKYKKLNRNGEITKRGKWAPDEEAFMLATFNDIPTEFIAGMLGRSYESVVCHANVMRLKKSEAYLSSPEAGRIREGGITNNGTRHAFKTGHATHNKGKKLEDYLDKGTIKKIKKTQFKKGNRPHHTKPRNGHISLRKEGGDGKRLVQYIRVKLGVWEQLHKRNWEKKHKRKIPKGHCLWFKDGDTLNAEPDNLELITRKENRIRNSEASRLPDEYIARMLVGTKSNRSKEMEQVILKNRPDLIQLKRSHILLNRELKNK